MFGAFTKLNAPFMRTVPSAPSKTPDAFKMPSPSTGYVVGSMPVMCVYSLRVAVSGILEARTLILLSEDCLLASLILCMLTIL